MQSRAAQATTAASGSEQNIGGSVEHVAHAVEATGEEGGAQRRRPLHGDGLHQTERQVAVDELQELDGDVVRAAACQRIDDDVDAR